MSRDDEETPGEKYARRRRDEQEEEGGDEKMSRSLVGVIVFAIVLILSFLVYLIYRLLF
jgi:hypothetical protein